MLIEADSNSIGRSIEQLEPRPWGLLGEFADGYSILLGSGALIRLCVAPWIAVVLMVGLDQLRVILFARTCIRYAIFIIPLYMI